MSIASPTRDYRTRIAAASLVVGPLLMTIGDLFHPDESMDTAQQIAIIVDHASRWYAAHLLLFIGMLLAIPGLLALTKLAEERKPSAGYAGRVLVLIGVAALSSIFVAEMLIGRYVSDGATSEAATALWTSTMSGPMAGAVGPALLAFFAGSAIFAIQLVKAGGTLRWIAALYSVGALLILAEIVSAQVTLSQIGNFMIFCGGTLAAWLILRGRGTVATAEAK